MTMARLGRTERTGAADRALTRVSADRHGVTYTLGAPTRQPSLFPEVQAPRQRTLAEAWSELCETDVPVFPVRLSPGAPWPKVRRFTPSFLTSILIHFSAVFFLDSIPFALMSSRLPGPPAEEVSSHPQRVLYEFRRLNLPGYLPVINSPSHGNPPGHGARPGARPRLGSSSFDPRITIVSNPPHPDNYRLTIKTENTPSDMRPPKDSKVPDLISGGTPLAPAAPRPSSSAFEKADNSKPEKPKGAPLLESPENQALALPLKPAEAAPGSPPNLKSATVPASDTQNPAGDPKLVALSVDPIPLKDVTAIPAGVRAGAFSIGPAGIVPGVPEGTPRAPPGVGKGGHGPGGENTVAAANGNGSPGGEEHGGSASGPAASPELSVSGPAGSTGISAGTLAPLKGEDLVYAVKPETPKARAPSQVVSSGSWGGGGLRIYGVLHGEKIYTVYFSMPGKNWILQYCARENPPPADAASRVVQIHIQPPLAPPAAVAQFDFRRPTAPPDPTHAMIILHGIIHEDGSLSDLEVLQGLDPISNDAAREAFSRWRFKPALRAGTPVALEILVGIP